MGYTIRITKEDIDNAYWTNEMNAHLGMYICPVKFALRRVVKEFQMPEDVDPWDDGIAAELDFADGRKPFMHSTIKEFHVGSRIEQSQIVDFMHQWDLWSAGVAVLKPQPGLVFSGYLGEFCEHHWQRP